MRQPNPTRRLPDGAREIIMAGGVSTVVNEEDYPKVCHLRWVAARSRSTLHAKAVCQGKHIAMHRRIMGFPRGFFVDHIDGDGLNNRRENLRVASCRLNTMNRRPCSKHGLPPGVWPSGKKFVSYFWIGKVRHYLGTFDTPQEAAVGWAEAHASAVRNQARLDQEAYERSIGLSPRDGGASEQAAQSPAQAPVPPGLTVHVLGGLHAVQQAMKSAADAIQELMMLCGQTEGSQPAQTPPPSG